MERRVNDSDINRLRAMIQKLSGVDNIENSHREKKENISVKDEDNSETSTKHHAKNSEPMNELFVKIDGHKEIAKDVLMIKEEMKMIANIVSLLAKLEKIKENSIQRLEKHLEGLKEAYQDMFSRLSYLDQNVNSFSLDEKAEGNIGDKATLRDLKSELEELKNMLDRL